MYQFNFSESQIRKTNRIMVIVFPFLFLLTMGFGLFASDFNINKVLIPLCVTYLIITPILTIESLLINRSLRRMKVLIYEDKIIKKCGKRHQTVLWDNIIKIKLAENPKGGLVNIRLYLKNEKAIFLGGFDEMEKIAHLVMGKISNNVLVQTKHYKLDAYNPIVPIIACISTMVIMCIIASGGNKAMDIFTILFALSVGCGLLIFRPLTKFSLSDKWFEIVSASLLIILGIYGFIIFLLTGKLP